MTRDEHIKKAEELLRVWVDFPAFESISIHHPTQAECQEALAHATLAQAMGHDEHPAVRRWWWSR